MPDFKKDFPIFQNNPGLVYLDSAATSLKPQSVIHLEAEYYEKYGANVFRGIYKISERATFEYEKTRDLVAQFINSSCKEEIVFTRNTTESLNLVAYSLGRQIVSEGDEIVTTIMEHHSNFVPWQQLALENGADFKVVGINQDGQLPAYWPRVITKKTKIIALTFVSNVLATINPVKEIIMAAKKINPRIIAIIDAAQAVPHMKVDVQDLGCDFLAFSSHKMLGPTGVGILWGKYDLLDKMYPFQFGGEMIEKVSVDKTTFAKPPYKFEAGTPAIGQVIALQKAVEYLQKIGMDEVRNHEKLLVSYALKMLSEQFGKKITIVGPKNHNMRAGVIAFSFGKYHPHDIAQILDEVGIAIRAGHHCAMPVHEFLKMDATARASFYIYNNTRDVDELVNGLEKVEKILG